MTAESGLTLDSSGFGGATAVLAAVPCASLALGGCWPGQPSALTTLAPAAVLGEFPVLSLYPLRAVLCLWHMTWSLGYSCFVLVVKVKGGRLDGMQGSCLYPNAS